MDFIPMSIMTTFLPEITITLILFLVLISLIFKPSSQLNQRIMHIFSYALISTGIITLMNVDNALQYNLKLFTSLNNWYSVDSIAMLSKGLILLIAGSLFIFIQNQYKQIGMEFMAITMLMLMGQFTVISAKHTLLLYVGIELMSLATCGLIVFFRQQKLSIEAAMKFVVMGAIASSLLLYGLSMLYGGLGTLDYHLMTQAKQINTAYLLLGLMFVWMAFAFKLGLVPFHAWMPDVYQGSNMPAMAFIATTAKIAAFVLVYRLFNQTLSILPMYAEFLQVMQAILIISMIVANLLGIMQHNIRRLLAYSTIANMATMLLVLSVLPSGQLDILMASNGLFYAIIYVLSMVLVLAVLMQTKAKTLQDLKGLVKQSPIQAWILLIAFFSMMGIPPLAGFHAKFSIINGLMERDLIGLAIFTLMVSVLAAFYYLRIIKCMFFDVVEHTESRYAKTSAAIDNADNYLQEDDVKHPIEKHAYAWMLLYIILIIYLSCQPSWLLDKLVKAFLIA